MFVKYTELRVNDVLRCDGGFLCMDEGDKKTVHYSNEDREFFIHCTCGNHYLIADEGADVVIGFWKVQEDALV